MPTVMITHNTGPGGELGHLGTWLAERRFDVELVNRDTTPISADMADDADLLVMLGSKWSVARPMTRPGDDPHAPAAIASEIELLRRRTTQDKPTLGICFGGQLLCHALGGQVRHLDRMFMDWETPEASIPELSREWFFVHEDHFTLPRHAQTLAEADHATVAFRHGKAWGLQFHPEVDARILDIWFDDLGMDRTKVDRHIHDALARQDANRADAHALLDTIWERMTCAQHEHASAR